MKIIGITQARIGSSRLPRKVLLEIKGKTLLQYHLERAIQSKMVDKWFVATTQEPESDLICNIASNLSIQSYKGSLNDVLDRFYQIAKDEKPDYIVRITSDCPLIDSVLIDKVVQFTINENVDYASNTFIEDFPDGQDIEVFRFSALEQAWKNANKPYQKEHVTPYIREHSSLMGGDIFISANFPSPGKYEKVRLTVDEEKDFEVISILIHDLGAEKGWLEYADYYENNEEIHELNSSIKRNEGYRKV